MRDLWHDLVARNAATKAGLDRHEKKFEPPAKRRMLACWLDPATVQQFRQIAARLGITQRQLLAEAIDRVIKEGGRADG